MHYISYKEYLNSLPVPSIRYDKDLIFLAEEYAPDFGFCSVCVLACPTLNFA